MGEQTIMRTPKTVAISLLVLFVMSLTCTAVSASAQDYKDGYKAGYTAGYTAGNEKGYGDGYADGAHTARELKKSLTGFEERAFSSEDYRRGYQAGYKAGYEEGYKNGYDEGFKEGAQSVS